MLNPFDFDDGEARKQFEKNTIYGTETEITLHDFMKKSFAAANMKTSLDDDDDEGSLKLVPHTQSGIVLYCFH